MPRRLPPPWIVLTITAGLMTPTRAALADGPGRDDTDFFEARVRPVLSASCWKCHGPDKQTSGLRLDSLAEILDGGDSGEPAIVRGKPEESPLVLAIRHTEDVAKMPPTGKLDDDQIEALTEWIRRGAPWPEAATGSHVEDPTLSHWAFQPVRPPNRPPVKDRAWIASPVDAFLLAALEAKGLAPLPAADRRTLIRRLSFDLVGLPPAAEEVEAYLADPSPDDLAYARVVDRLLASPHYGERWGRHWLDVARYADSKGYVFQEERRYPFAYTYRDYVVRAFNEDMPYSEFLTEQLAADLRPESRGEPSRLAALGFLTVGRRFLNNNDDILDDRIDVVTRGLLGLTVACARCHDHKFDPIPSEDYYSLYGVFASSAEPADLPRLDPSAPADPDYLKAKAESEAAVRDYLATMNGEHRKELREKLGAYLGAALAIEGQPEHPRLDETARAAKLRPELLRWLASRWDKPFAELRARHPAVFAAWEAATTFPEDSFAPLFAEAVARSALNESAAATRRLAEHPPETFAEAVAFYGEVLATAADDSPLARAVADESAPWIVPTDEQRRTINRVERDKIRALERKVAEVDVTHSAAPPRAMVVNDKPRPYDPRVFVRGNPGRPGKSIPRRFLRVLSGPDRQPFGQGSGRLGLALAIADPANPLTARVMVNRVWQHHFGRGLVATPSDFGLRSDPPTHPGLLDDLAASFVASGGSIKDLHRRILLSNAYRQRSDDRPEAAAIDPENRLLWRANRRRLDFESTRDAILSVGSGLEARLGGRPVSLFATPFPARRTLYGEIDRQNLDGVYRAFDFAIPDASSPGRHVTTVPQQALFLLNSPWAVAQAEALGTWTEAESHGDREAGVAGLYRRVLARPPGDAERSAALAFLGGPPDEASARWKALAQVLMISNEFFFVD